MQPYKNLRLVSEASLKQAGAAAVLLQGNAIQIIFGPQAFLLLKTKIDDYLENVPEAYDEKKQLFIIQQI